METRMERLQQIRTKNRIIISTILVGVGALSVITICAYIML